MSQPAEPPIFRVESVASTNEALIALATAGATDGTALAATSQTAGRGRHGRSWQSLPGRQVLLSVLYRPRLDLGRLAGLTLDIGVAVAEVLEGHGLSPRLKWPNDLLLEGKKVGGILCEVVDGPCVVVGLGLNVEGTELPADLLPRATTLAAAGVDIDVETLLAELVPALRLACAAYDRRGAPAVASWRRRATTLGQRLRCRADGRVGCVEDVAHDGALLVRWDGAARAERFIAGDLEVITEGSP